MKKLEGESRVHEEFRLKLEKEKEVELAELKARVEMAEQQASILAKAFANANFNIVRWRRRLLRPLRQGSCCWSIDRRCHRQQRHATEPAR